MTLLTSKQMYQADQLAIASGLSEATLMENAGRSVAEEIEKKLPNLKSRSVLVLAGPGKNGCDGIIAGRILKNDGWNVTIAQLKNDKEQLEKSGWGGSAESFSLRLLKDKPFIIDAIFGIGLSKNITGHARDLMEKVNELGLPVVAVDIPSGIDADTGEAKGSAMKCLFTVSFFMGKPGLFLLPGKAFAGEVLTKNIGIPLDVLKSVKPSTYLNHPMQWFPLFPKPNLFDHKYSKGVVLTIGGKKMTGAARLASRAARRIGAGISVIATLPESHNIYATSEVGSIVETIHSVRDILDLIERYKVTACVVGPGLGVSEETKQIVLNLLEAKVPCVLDADALTSFKDDPNVLFSAIKGPCIMTPHSGEFDRLFSFKGDKLNRTIKAAKKTNAVIVHKGNDTVIADPDGKVFLNYNAPASLATAGSGDVLAGIIAGLLAQNTPEHIAASAGVFIHGETAIHTGMNLIAEDLPAAIPEITKQMFKFFMDVNAQKDKTLENLPKMPKSAA